MSARSVRMPSPRSLLREWLPRGQTLPEEAWSRRHRWVLVLLWLHAVGLFAFSAARGYGLAHSALEGAAVAGFALAAQLLPGGHRVRSAFASLGLLTASAVLVHLADGAIEAHFHYFVVIAVVALYEDWIPFLTAFAYVVLQHGIAGAVPDLVFDHVETDDDPWFWAGIHGAFVSAAGIVGIVSWRLNEELRLAAHETEARLSEAQQIAGLGSWCWDTTTDEVTWSRQLYRLLGFDPEEVQPSYEGYFEPVHPDDRAHAESAIQEARATRRPFAYEARLVRDDGVRHVLVRGHIVEDASGDETCLIGTVQDISERKELDRRKDEFTSVVSHELRTPLTSIRGSLGLLTSGVLGPLPEKGQRMLDIAVQNTDRLVRLINDILDIERIEAGKVTMEPRETDAAELMTQAEELMRGMATDAGVTLAVSPLAAQLWVDPDRVMQTLTNLLSNAIKFSPAGATVTLAAEHRGNELVFSVRDEGRGIPAGKLESIFERFQQVDSSDSREKGGTGLGLAICRSIVEQHGGRIWAESAPGEGATLSFTLPTVAAPELEAHPAGAGPTVLVCDDDESVRVVIAAMLAEHGYRAILAATGEQTLALAVSERPAAIMLDLLMPGMSGWETAATLRRRPETQAIPVVITSVLSASEAGLTGDAAVDWIEKPIDEAALFRVLESVVTPGEAPRVLIVEDDVDLGAVLSAMLEEHGVEAHQAVNRREAIELSQRLRPDLLVLDLMLPELDGFAVADWLRLHDSLGSVPLVVYTGRDLDEDDRRRLGVGPTEFLVNGSVTPQEFEQQLLALLGRITAQPDPQRGGAMSASL